MASNTFCVVVTGANKGIGKALATRYLSRPNTTVIAAVRNLDAASIAFDDVPVEARRSLVLVKIDSLSATDALEAVNSLSAKHGITKVDLLIANAGIGTKYDAASETPLESLIEHFRVNAGGTLLLFQAFRPLLQAAAATGDGSPKLVVLSSAIASLALTGSFPLQSTAYGASKAAANFIVQRIHAEEEWLVTFPISPGWVRTSMGDNAATMVGMAQAPMTVNEGASGIMQVIEGASRATTSGTFVDYEGKPILW